MSYQETVETVNAALVEASNADAMQCRKLVTEVYLEHGLRSLLLSQ